MKSYDPQVLMDGAKNLAKRHPLNNPLHNPSALSQFNQSSQDMIAAIAASPQHAAVAMGQATPAAGGGLAAPGPLEGHQLKRSPTSRHNIIGC